jgi:group I intron endonuclease
MVNFTLHKTVALIASKTTFNLFMALFFILSVYPNIVLESLHLLTSSLQISIKTSPEILLSLFPAFIKLDKNKEDSNSTIPLYSYEDIIGSRFQIQKDLNKKCGVYQFINKNDPTKTYVGSSINLWERIRYHIRLANNINYTYRSLLYKGVVKYKWKGFKLIILETVENNKEILLTREQFYLDQFKPYYNILSEAGSTIGRVSSIETRDKISKSLTGKSHSVETKLKMSEAHKNKVFSEETKAKLSKEVFIYSFNLETKIKIFHKSFSSCIEAAKYLDCCTHTISRYLDKNKLYKKQWMLYSTQQD